MVRVATKRSLLAAVSTSASEITCCVAQIGAHGPGRSSGETHISIAASPAAPLIMSRYGMVATARLARSPSRLS